jgi:ABC-type oligopeptide transport system ATPase subunit
MSSGLRLIDLRRRFEDVVALDGVSFDVDEGSMVGFVGPNGAGKTTAMRIVLGVLEPDGGAVRWKGRPVDAAARARRRRGGSSGSGWPRSQTGGPRRSRSAINSARSSARRSCTTRSCSSSTSRSPGSTQSASTC